MKSLKIGIFALAILATAGQLWAQSRETRTTGPFDEVATTGNILVKLVPSDQEEIKVRTSGVELDRVVTEVSQGILKIRMKPGIYKDATVNVTVRYRRLRELRATAGGEYYSDEVISGDKLTIKASAGGIANLEVDLNAVEAKVGEGGKVILSGLADSQRSSASSGGIVYAEELESEVVSVKVSTGGKAEVYASGSLEANVSTGGKLTYFGEPGIETIKTSLGAKVEKR